MSYVIIKDLFNLLIEFDIKYVICSPGSRNAALLQEIENFKEIKKLVIVDERTAAFVGLGISLVSRKPVALICTSGTALLNYAPAVAEAYYQHIPLIVVSADRPAEWIDQDDSQTIRQYGILSNITKASIDISANREENDYIWYANRIFNEILLKATSQAKGPVHINIHLSGEILQPIKEHHIPRKVERLLPPPRLDKEEIKHLSRQLMGKKIMVVAGFMPPDNKLQQAVRILSKLPEFTIMAETVSNLHLPQSSYIIDPVLFNLSSKEEELMKPDIVISIGGALISRKLKEFLRRNPPEAHWSFGYSDTLVDCFKSLTLKLECEPAPLLKAIGKQLRNHMGSTSETAQDYNCVWEKERKKYSDSINTYPWCDLKALSITLNSLPSDANLFLSNGTSIRYGQIIKYPITHATYSNRGVSGIEGCTSTALGASICYDRFTCLIVGDMSFAYDIGAITSQIAGRNMRIIVLDNNGGDIFRFIPATRNLAIREDYLSVPRKFPISMIADAFGWSYFYASNEKELRSELKEFFGDSLTPCILHIDTSKAKNSEMLRKYLNKRF